MSCSDLNLNVCLTVINCCALALHLPCASCGRTFCVRERDLPCWLALSLCLPKGRMCCVLRHAIQKDHGLHGKYEGDMYITRPLLNHCSSISKWNTVNFSIKRLVFWFFPSIKLQFSLRASSHYAQKQCSQRFISQEKRQKHHIHNPDTNDYPHNVCSLVIWG